MRRKNVRTKTRTVYDRALRVAMNEFNQLQHDNGVRTKSKVGERSEITNTFWYRSSELVVSCGIESINQSLSEGQLLGT